MNEKVDESQEQAADRPPIPGERCNLPINDDWEDSCEPKCASSHDVYIGFALWRLETFRRNVHVLGRHRDARAPYGK